MLIELFMTGFFSLLLGYIICFALGMILAIFIFGQSITVFQAIVITPFIGFIMAIICVIFGFILKLIGD